MFLEKASQHHLPPLSTALTTTDKQIVPKTGRLMAHELVMPIPQFTSSPAHHTLYQPHQQHAQQPLSPINSATASPHNASPTSPRAGPPLSAAHTQLRPPKSPLYIPAVLRPTDPPKRVAKPLTPPQSMHNSFDDLENAKTLSRRSTADSGKLGLGDIIEGECSLEGLGKVTGVPTREHWKPDSSTTICDDPTCTQYFSYFTRRHHCRRCGNIFCDRHSPYSVPLDQDANYHPRGARSRACEHCWGDYKTWYVTRVRREEARTGSGDGDAGEGEGEGGRTQMMSCKGKARGAIKGIFGGKGPDGGMGASVPRDWNWSTF